jgi:hypothetical protein
MRVNLSKLKTATFLIAAFLVACAVFFVWRSCLHSVGNLVVGGRPPEADFVGQWLLDPQSLPSVTNRTGTTVLHAGLTLYANGRFTAVDFPIEDGFSNPKWRLKTGAGRWELYRNQYWVIDLGFVDGFSTPLVIREKQGQILALTDTVGGPDSGEMWIWRRAKSLQKTF